ncbi:MAG: hypothetical protein H6618_09930 [Deltaproteobacteria bacterium]|nr:hypothetical protein [Deltaproteobacteria bacterium]
MTSETISGGSLKYALIICFLVFIAVSCEKKRPESSDSGAVTAGSESSAESSGEATETKGSDQTGQDIGVVSGVDSSLVDQFLQLVSEISARAPLLNREMDLRGRLRLALGAQVGAGCMQDVRVRSIEVIIDGQNAGDIRISDSVQDVESLPQGNGQSVFEFSFGDSLFSHVLTFSNDEKRNALFSPGTRKTWVPESSDFMIGQIQRIRIRKLSGSFVTRDRCEGGNFYSSCKNKPEVIEQDRYSISSLKIKVNGELIYERGGLSHLFARYPGNGDQYSSVAYGWSDDHLNINEAYVRMKQRDDCTSFQ